MQTIAEEWKREGIKIGEKIGEKRGEERGEKRGEERGIAMKAIETAKNLLEMGIDVDMIAKATGLKKEQVEKLASINH
jgi:predicted transposase/invertase (TIGR01784 family)